MNSFASDAPNLQRREDIISAQAVTGIKGQGDRWTLACERRFPSRSIAAKVLMGVNLRADAWHPVTPNAPSL